MISRKRRWQIDFLSSPIYSSSIAIISSAALSVFVSISSPSTSKNHFVTSSPSANILSVLKHRSGNRIASHYIATCPCLQRNRYHHRKYRDYGLLHLLVGRLLYLSLLFLLLSLLLLFRPYSIIVFSPTSSPQSEYCVLRSQ